MYTSTQAKAALQTEVDASYLYAAIAASEDEPALRTLFENLSQIEHGHGLHLQADLQKEGISMPLPKPSWRAKLLNRIGKIFGYEYVISALVDTEESIAYAQMSHKSAAQLPVSGSENNHATILKNVLANRARLSGQGISKIEGKHKSIGGNALRAAVLGANDGLVSNLSLVMGVAGATADSHTIIIAGIAGLLAGGFSMSLGEWISVKSAQELAERQMEIERMEIEADPVGEERELALIYLAKGIEKETAERMAHEVMSNKSHAYEVLVKEELGIHMEELKGSPWEAAVSSFILFIIGASIPVSPFFFFTGYTAIMISVGFSTLGLFAIGSAITLFTGKSVWYSGMRQVLFGILAAAITFAVGKLLGVAVS
jgi:VIT1/CCC1 family predicted Fe2+/Mn2+ transporter